MPRASLTIDTSGFEKKAAEAVRTEAVRRRVVVEAAERMIRRQLELASGHVDTGRYMRATAEAGNAARLGLATFPLAPVTPSKMQARLLQILQKQVRRWQTWHDYYVKEGRQSQRYFRKIEKRLRRSKEELQKFTDNMERGVIVVGAFQTERLVTVRVNFSAYGGTGAVRNLGGTTIVVLHNKEPHASIVESRFAITRTAMREVGDLKRVAKRAYKAHMMKVGFATG